MTKNKIITCSKDGCDEPLYSGGLCKAHHDQDSKELNRYIAAINCLHTYIIEGTLPTHPELRSDLQKIRVWWERACTAKNFDRDDEHLRDNTLNALDWCTDFATALIDAELAYRSGQTIPDNYSSAKQIAWTRFSRCGVVLDSDEEV